MVPAKRQGPLHGSSYSPAAMHTPIHMALRGQRAFHQPGDMTHQTDITLAL